MRKPLNLADPLDIHLERAGMKRFYPEASVRVMGVDDPKYAAFLDLLDAQDNFITRLTIDADLRATLFYPRGWLLRNDPRVPMDLADRLLIEEEIPRIGARLKRKFQYARSSDGRCGLWIGRSKLAGRRESSSGLRFDVAVKRPALPVAGSSASDRTNVSGRSAAHRAEPTIRRLGHSVQILYNRDQARPSVQSKFLN